MKKAIEITETFEQTFVIDIPDNLNLTDNEIHDLFYDMEKNAKILDDTFERVDIDVTINKYGHHIKGEYDEISEEELISLMDELGYAH